MSLSFTLMKKEMCMRVSSFFSSSGFFSMLARKFFHEDIIWLSDTRIASTSTSSLLIADSSTPIDS